AWASLNPESRATKMSYNRRLSPLSVHYGLDRKSSSERLRHTAKQYGGCNVTPAVSEMNCSTELWSVLRYRRLSAPIAQNSLWSSISIISCSKNAFAARKHRSRIDKRPIWFTSTHAQTCWILAAA